MTKRYKIAYTQWGWTVYKRVFFFFWEDTGPIYRSLEHARQAVRTLGYVEYHE